MSVKSVVSASGYIESFLNGEHLCEVINRMNTELRGFGIRKFDAIAFRGVSGSFVAPAVAAALGKKLIVVRKTTDGSHAYKKVEGWTGSLRYVIIDDIICSGDTVNAIINSVDEQSKGQNKLVAIALYNDGKNFSYDYARGNILEKHRKTHVINFRINPAPLK